jgi:hypothetical protein
MKPNLTLSLIAAAVLAATPALAQNTSARWRTRQGDHQHQRRDPDPLPRRSRCAPAEHPNAGKLADKSTAMAKEHSSSPVHRTASR